MANQLAIAVLDALPDSTAVLDRYGTIVAVNHAWRMFCLDNGGRAAATDVGVNYLDVCSKSAAGGCADAGVVIAEIRSVLAGKSVEAEVEYACPSPAAGRWFMLRISPLAGPEPGAVVSHANITRRKMSEDELAHAASHDPLSGLANRTLFTDQLTVALAPRRGARAEADVGVLYLDLDGFKAINDTYGHTAGDEVLLTVAHRLRRGVRPGDTVARLGGDEFAIIAPRLDAAGLEAVTSRLDDALAKPHRVHGNALVIPCSIGTYLATAGQTTKEIIEHADSAMYQIKKARKNTPR